MAEKIVLVGGGGHCKSVLNTIYKLGIYTDVVITDSALAPGSMILNAKVVGDDSTLPDLLKQGYSNAIITVGSIKSTDVRRKIYKELEQLGFGFPTIIDPSASVSEYAEIGEGVFVGSNASVNAEAQIGAFAIINTSAIIEHESSIGRFSHIAVGATVCGNVLVGDDVFVGAGATLIQGVTIGDCAIIGAGSLVNKDVYPNSMVCGVPARGCNK
ncbi:sugar O-acyltransferase, sialic acid O-acetyltransferase NeuD family [Lachnospiraceae bacterium YSD2013]|nr:sugar O-acyltransferase, sialic acid O-acetyltransferase NeuD family [Lachnospiraceae bacterium YSD2013]